MCSGPELLSVNDSADPATDSLLHQLNTSSTKPLARTVLALNSGSSSLKYGVYHVDENGPQMLLAGNIETLPQAMTDLTAGLESALARVRREISEAGLAVPDTIGHRVVHGGPTLRQHCVIDAGVITALEAASGFAPLHTPTTVAAIRLAAQQFPNRPQVACFDTCFHVGLPDVARVFPIPRKLQRAGIERYGFHGLSCESTVQQLGATLPARLVIAHLGNGSSVTAVRAGRSVDTTMGLTPTGGIPMGTRSGDLDPGVLLYLMREHHYTAAQLAELVDHRAGLLGLSGLSSDMRQLHAAAPGNAEARLAIEMFCYSVRKSLAAMTAVLEGVDMMVFTGGIGENDSQIRAAICNGLMWLGVALDEQRNRQGRDTISTAASPCIVRVLPALESDRIAHHSWMLTSTSVASSAKQGQT